MKYYPAGATTNSDSGVTDIRKCDRVFEAMQQVDIPLLLHGEVTDSHVDMFDREKVFIEEKLAPLKQRFPDLRVVLEHVTHCRCGGICAGNRQHRRHPLHLNISCSAATSFSRGGLRPHYYCLPILKRETHREVLLQAATSGNPKFFLGTDSAPHPRHGKESSCGCAGCFSALHAMELYAEVFEGMNAPRQTGSLRQLLRSRLL